MSWSRDDVENRVGDVLRRENLADAGRELAADLLADVGDELALGRAGLDQRRTDVAGSDLLAQGFAEGPDAVLGELVDAAAGSDAPARDRADVDEVRDPARLALGGAQEVRERRVGDVEQIGRASCRERVCSTV